MTAMETFLAISLITLSIFCLFTVCMLTFQKGHVVLGIVGMSILWLIGAILPAKEGSRYEVAQEMHYQQQVAR